MICNDNRGAVSPQICYKDDLSAEIRSGCGGTTCSDTQSNEEVFKITYESKRRNKSQNNQSDLNNTNNTPTMQKRNKSKKNNIAKDDPESNASKPKLSREEKKMQYYINMLKESEEREKKKKEKELNRKESTKNKAKCTPLKGKNGKCRDTAQDDCEPVELKIELVNSDEGMDAFITNLTKSTAKECLADPVPHESTPQNRSLHCHNLPPVPQFDEVVSQETPTITHYASPYCIGDSGTLKLSNCIDSYTRENNQTQYKQSYLDCLLAYTKRMQARMDGPDQSWKHEAESQSSSPGLNESCMLLNSENSTHNSVHADLEEVCQDTPSLSHQMLENKSTKGLRSIDGANEHLGEGYRTTSSSMFNQITESHNLYSDTLIPREKPRRVIEKVFFVQRLRARQQC